ncbi:hypothetical protein [Thiolapillus brandeum]|uniref:hypothetical protein n=1 Tax=Thiolapillus brandeum TaxID=1076588 RepID=UPI000597D333|nr:hypothetical protein [Thiolapillus brandeum]
MKVLITILISLGVIMNAIAEPVRIETNSFLFELPVGWKIIELSSQAKLNGPNNEFLIVSSYNISGEGKKSDLKAIKEEFGKNIVKTMQESASESDLNITSQLINQTSPNGYPIWSIHTETKDGSQFFDQFGTVGIKTAILVTIEGILKNKSSSEVVFNAVREIKWY